MGDPASPYLNEPAPNGGRVNQGYDGNTPQAATSPAQLVQVLAPANLDKLQVNQTVTVDYRSAGLPTPPDYYADAVLADHPLAYYPLSDAAGSTTAVDVSGNGYDGTYQGGVTLGVTGALPDDSDTAAEFDGSTGCVTLPDGLIQGSTVLTVEAWFRTSASGVILGYQNGDYPSPGNGYVPALYVGTDGLLRGELWYGGPNPITSASAVNDGQWHYVVLVADSNVQYLYLDGNLVGNASGNIDPFDGMCNQIGGGYTSGWPAGNGGAFAFNGEIDDVAIYDTALSAAQVQNHYQQQYYGTVNVNLVQGGVTVASIAQGVSNTGTFAWTIPSDTPLRDDYQIEVQANESSQPVGYSSGVFSIANNGPDYYVSASGSNANSGKTPDQPMASLAALLAVYADNFQPGDTINVDMGTYNEVRNLVLGPQLSGVTIQGPAGGGAVLDRGNLGQCVFELAGAQDVTLDDLGITGGSDGICAWRWRGEYRADGQQLHDLRQRLHGCRSGIQQRPSDLE